jgi:hypothetical protein
MQYSGIVVIFLPYAYLKFTKDFLQQEHFRIFYHINISGMFSEQHIIKLLP